MKQNNGSRVHFSTESRSLDGRKNIDDVWWVNGIGDRRREIENIDKEIGRLNESIDDVVFDIGTIDAKIARRQNNIEFIKGCLKYGAIFAGGALAISVLGAGVSEGIRIWCGLMILPTVVGVSAKIVQGNFENEIESLEEDKCFEEIDRDSYQRQIDELSNKKEVIRGIQPKFRSTGQHEIIDRPPCIYYQRIEDGDDNNYGDEVFQVGGTEPYNWTANKLIKSVASQESFKTRDIKVKTR